MSEKPGQKTDEPATGTPRPKTKIEDLPQPEEELDPTQAGEVRGGLYASENQTDVVDGGGYVAPSRIKKAIWDM
jgi:hypothetical protein